MSSLPLARLHLSLEQIVLSGRLVDFALLVLVVESIAVILIHRRTGQGPDAPRVLSNAAAGGTLMLALRAALVGQGWLWITLWLLCALVAHVTDLALRWRG
jgi:hypothetical protein